MSKHIKNRPVKRGEKSDFTLEDRLKLENKKLKRQLAKLRNLIKRSDLSRLEHLEKLVDEQREFDKTIKKSDNKAKEKWICHDCGEGYMMPRIFKRRDGDFYYRICNNEQCSNRTHMKKIKDNTDLSLLEKEEKE